MTPGQRCVRTTIGKSRYNTVGAMIGWQYLATIAGLSVWVSVSSFPKPNPQWGAGRVGGPRV